MNPRVVSPNAENTRCSEKLAAPVVRNSVIRGDALTTLKTIPDESVNCCVTSPPYWGLRDYGTAKWEGGIPECDHKVGRFEYSVSEKQKSNNGSAGHQAMDVCPKCGAVRIDEQLGLEKTPEEYVNKLVEVFREVRRVLRKDGTLWLNLGDSYSGAGWRNNGLKPKDLVGIPWRVAFALQADGWWLRQDIIWHKPNPMPESVRDRCTKAHEYIFLLSKQAKYYYDADAVKEPFRGKDERQWAGNYKDDGSIIQGDTKKGIKRTKSYPKEYAGGGTSFNGHSGYYKADGTPIGNGFRNLRSVWTVTTKPYKEAHFATFPPKLIEPCILAGCPRGGVVLDPFIGSGTVAMVATQLGRDYIGIDLNPTYIELAEKRKQVTMGLF